MKDSVWHFAEHVAATDKVDIPDSAIKAAKIFLLDTLGVGVVGSAAPFVDELITAAAAAGVSNSRSARVFASGERLSPPGAALLNAFQIHNSEFDCVHEAAVVHPLAVILGAMTAFSDAEGGISGSDFISAMILGVDVAAGLGVASNSPLKFFRPATAGGFGAAAALARLKGLDVQGVVRAMSAAYGQMGGTMQAHTEGKGLLPMQVGFNARNALLAADLAALNVDAPENILDGPYGYYANFEGSYDLSGVIKTLGNIWRITEVAHKPFPSGRATHGILDAALQVQKKHGLNYSDITAVHCKVPSLTQRLIGRPALEAMTPNYARLSGQYVVASALMRGTVNVEDFYAEALNDPKRLELAKKIIIETDANPDPNALAPVNVAIQTDDGSNFQMELEKIYGSPSNPMTHEAHLSKFKSNFQAARPKLPASQAEELIKTIDNIEAVSDMRSVIDLCVAS
ncbi:MAG: MmgE/PrpD family protein, partial [Rhodospirillales bacterium]